MPEPLIDITVSDGKYRIIQTDRGYTQAFRHGETWLDVTNTPGGNMILAMAYELEELRGKLKSHGTPIPEGADQCVACGGHGFTL